MYIKRSYPNSTFQSVCFLIWHGKQTTSARCTTWRRKPKKLLQVSPKTNGTQEIQKSHWAICCVISSQPPMTHLPHKAYRLKRQLRHHSSFKHRIQQSEHHEQNRRHDSTRFELGKRKISGRGFQIGFNAIEFFGGFGVGIRRGFERVEFFGRFFDLEFEGFVRGGSIDQEIGDCFAQDCCRYGD